MKAVLSWLFIGALLGDEEAREHEEQHDTQPSGVRAEAKRALITNGRSSAWHIQSNTIQFRLRSNEKGLRVRVAEPDV
jgi:hypothetical protein